VRRFTESAERLIALHHPAIAQTLEYGHRDGLGWVATEWVTGEPVSARYRAGPMPPEDARRLFYPLAEGLARAHDGGVAHGDLRPSNLLIGGNGVGRIVGFSFPSGVVRARTGQRALIRALQYLPSDLISLVPLHEEGAPAQGSDALAVHLWDDETTGLDLYALGQLLYEALVGQELCPAHQRVTALQLATRQILRFSGPGMGLDPGTPTPSSLRESVFLATSRSSSSPYTLASMARDLRSPATSSASPPSQEDESITVRAFLDAERRLTEQMTAHSGADSIDRYGNDRLIRPPCPRVVYQRDRSHARALACLRSDSAPFLRIMDAAAELRPLSALRLLPGWTFCLGGYDEREPRSTPGVSIFGDSVVDSDDSAPALRLLSWSMVDRSGHISTPFCEVFRSTTCPGPHAALRAATAGRGVLYNLNREHSIYVNSIPVSTSAALLSSGDVIQVGSVSVLFAHGRWPPGG